MRDKRIIVAEAEHIDGAEEKPAAPMPEAAADKAAPRQKERDPLWESEEVVEGAKSLAARVARVKDIADAKAKRAALLRVLTAGREYYYVMEPGEVLVDLEKRGLVGGSLATELHKLLEDGAATGAATKEGPVPTDKWLAHAQKL